MSKAILVGYDPRTIDRAPVRFGVAMARLIAAPLIVGSVYAESVMIAQMGHGQMDTEMAEEARAALEHLRRELQAKGVRAECRPLPGASTPVALHHASESLGAGLLVVGSTRRGPVSRAVGGSTAERLLRGARCPVAVVPFEWEEGAGLNTIGVAAADSAQEQSADALARRMGATLRVLPVEGDASAQAAADALVDASHGLDLLVCASHGHELRRGVVLGGVAPRVIAAAHCPVIVLARGLESGLRALIGEREGATA